MYRYERTPSGRMGHVTELNGAALYLAACVESSHRQDQLIGSNCGLASSFIEMRALFALERTLLSMGAFFLF